MIVKKRESQIIELDQIKLKTVVLHDCIGKEIDMTRPIGFVAGNLYQLIIELFGAHLDKLCDGLIPWE